MDSIFVISKLVKKIRELSFLPQYHLHVDFHGADPIYYCYQVSQQKGKRNQQQLRIATDKSSTGSSDLQLTPSSGSALLESRSNTCYRKIYVPLDTAMEKLKNENAAVISVELPSTPWRYGQPYDTP
jgi:hypothetical protein